MKAESNNTEHRLARIAASCIVSVLGAVAISRVSVNEGFNQAVVVWLISTIVIGSALRPDEELSEIRAFVKSIPAAATALVVWMFRMLFLGEVPISGIEISFAKPYTLLFLTLIGAATTVAIWLFGYARVIVADALRTVFGLSAKKRKSVTDTLKWVIAVVGLGYLLLKAFAG